MVIFKKKINESDMERRLAVPGVAPQERSMAVPTEALAKVGAPDRS